MPAYGVADHVNVTFGGEELEGVVAYVDGDRLGIRLTDFSVGLGDHDGEGLFEAPNNSGLWVSAADVSERALATSIERVQPREMRFQPLEQGPVSSSSTTSAEKGLVLLERSLKKGKNKESCSMIIPFR